ncbi:MAG: hypothetical protein O2816_13795, partial [Planctomycetota bacterium]|nr:hypothetical protein [Planctomycetota bacterium]
MRRAILLAAGLAAFSCQRPAHDVREGAGLHAHDLETPALARNLDRARGLYRDHCALCHGDRGEGDGPAAALLHPPARDFTLGFFRLATTEN